MTSPENTRLKQLFTELGFMPYIKKKKFDILCRLFAAVEFGKGELVIAKGEQDDSFFIISEGSARIMMENEHNAMEEVRRIGKGNFLGEIALLTGGYRTAWVMASEDLKAFRISKDALEEHLLSIPEISDIIMDTARRRFIT
jgi:CRP-like cAMP-binding protein